ncbi:MAG: glycosyltransferase family protein [Alphaproteobacteria bacterium]|nr:glycosyltransferase family protein [Alphaproteobacteria bacterium]MCK5554764.1 glycosyltransferase family protein [Alphaproteobacteria bacterium]
MTQILEGDAACSYIANLINTKQYKEAEPILLDVLSRTPDAVIALTALGIVYRSTDRFTAAEACYRRALELNQDDAEVYSNLGNLLTDMDRLEEATTCAERAVSLNPASLLYRKNLAVTQREYKKFEEALKSYMWCHEQKNDDPQVLLNISIVCFYLRQFDKAWDYYERRFETNRINFPKLSHMPQWKGEELTDKKLLVVTEQGFGDTILMTRFFSLLKEKCPDVTLCCKPALHKLFSSLPTRVIDEAEISQHNFDYFIPMMSLPRLIEQDWLKWPTAPQLAVSDESRKKFSFLAEQKGRLKIGVVWSGSVTFGENVKRSVTIDHFHKLSAKFPQIQFYSFQKGAREQDIVTSGQGVLCALGHLFNDFSDTAAALEQMDLILMTDSALSHLAGSFNIPVINMLNFKPYWLYFPENTSTPLYPSMRLVRQTNPGDWDDVLERVEGLLQQVLIGWDKIKSRQQLLDVLDESLSLSSTVIVEKTPKAKVKKKRSKK